MSDINSLIGTRVLGYNITEFIGEGGFGKVYKAEKLTGNDKYYAAIKHIVLPNESNYNDILNSMGGNFEVADSYFEAMLNDMIAEIKTLFSLSKSNNQNIVTYYDHDIIKHTNPLKYEIFIRMEYLKPLSAYIRENDITLKDVIKLGVDISKALEYCHSQGIIHRDVKDDNIFINEDGNYKLGDFGISKALMDTKQALSIKGTPVYMAPEVILGEKYDKTVDIYSLGVLLYKLLNHNRIPFLPKYPLPFTNRDMEEAIEARLRGKELEEPTNSAFGLGRVILKACATKGTRYTEAKQLTSDLENILNTMPEEELSKVLYNRTERKVSHNNTDSDLTVGAGRENQGFVAMPDKDYKGKDIFETQYKNDYEEKATTMDNNYKKVKNKKPYNKLIFAIIGLAVVILILCIVLAKSLSGNNKLSTSKNSNTGIVNKANSNGASSADKQNTQGTASKDENKTQANSSNTNSQPNDTKDNSNEKKNIDVSKCSQTIFDGKTVITLTSVELDGKDLIIKGEVDNKAKENVLGHVSEFYLKYKDNNVNKLNFFLNPSFNIEAPSGAKTKFEMKYSDVDTSQGSISLCGEFFMMSYFDSDKKINIDIPIK